MRKLNLLLPAIAISTILITGCKKNLSDFNPTPAQLQDESRNAARPKLSAAQLQANINQLVSALASENKSGLISNPDLVIMQEPGYKELVQNATAVVPTPCNANTPLSLWLDGELADWNSTVFSYAINTGMLDLPTYDAFIFENSSANQYFGRNGEYTQRLVKTFKDLKRFWNIESDDIAMVAMHGGMLRDRDKLIRTYVAVFGLSPASAALYADLVLALLDFFPQYRNGDHPIFTFNAFAVESFEFPPYGIIPDKIVIGDGIMEAYTALGFGDVAPQAILAHEFGHHIQSDLNLFGPFTPESTRRTELMADAYSAYYLSHARGASMQWKRVQQFLQVFFNIGDCGFTSPDHHGTPTQRMAAAEWGYSIANDAQKQGHILTVEEFTALFDAQLPALVAL
ncbi:MAG TPA: hypothetical protein VKA49_16875 [Flavitalea sp.]|nr:hypothetical protein [Flavitalea sp.]